MHHWGRRSLEVNEVHFCSRDRSNRFDSNAVAVYSDANLTNTVAYLQRKDAAVIAGILQYAGRGKCYLKAKTEPEKFNKFKGPMQRCNIGFKCDDNDVASLRILLSDYAIKIF